MPNTTEQLEYVSALKVKLGLVREQIEQARANLKTLTTELDERLRQADHLVELLKAEKVSLDAGETVSVVSLALSELAYQDMMANASRRPRHYLEIAQSLLKAGIHIPGKNPSANLLAHITRDARFVRTAPGSYALREWGVEPQTKTSGRRRRKRRVRKS